MFHHAREWRILLLVILASVLTGCFNSVPTLPEWAKNIPSSEHVYYSVGQGVNLYDAEQNARASLAAELSSTVSDMTRVHTVDDGAFKQQSIEQFTSVEVSKVNISNAKVVKQEQSGGQYFVLMELSSQDLSVQLKAELKGEVRVLSQVLKAKKSERFEDWWNLRTALPNAKRLARNIRLLNAYDGEPYEQESSLLASFFKKFDESFAYRKLAIDNSTSEKRFFGLVSQAMKTEGIELLESSMWRSQDNIEVDIDYSSQRIGQEFHIDAEMWIRLKSTSGQTLSQFSLKDRGISYSGYKQSKEIANQQLYTRLKRSNIFERLLN